MATAPPPAGMTDPVTSVAAAVAALFPASVHSAVRAVAGEEALGPHPEESVAVRGAVATRRAEFFAGRACAHDAIAAVGAADGAIAVGEHREPLWPAGVVGSIAHTRSLAAAAVALAGDAWGVGLDVETLREALGPRLRERLFSPREAEGLAGDEAVEPAAPLVVFSAKESVFKCLFPRTRWLLGFQDVAIRLDLRTRRFEATIGDRFDVAGALPSSTIEGAFAVAGGHVLTGLVV